MENTKASLSRPSHPVVNVSIMQQFISLLHFIYIVCDVSVVEFQKRLLLLQVLGQHLLSVVNEAFYHKNRSDSLNYHLNGFRSLCCVLHINL